MSEGSELDLPNLLYNRFLQILNFDFCPVFTTFGEFSRVFASFREFSRVSLYTSYCRKLFLQILTNFSWPFHDFSQLLTTFHEFSRLFTSFHDFCRVLLTFQFKYFFQSRPPLRRHVETKFFIHINSRKLAKTREKLVKTRENSWKLAKTQPLATCLIGNCGPFFWTELF